jgi:dTDP-4-amino-4,6-dideoxygalactose transaminase
VATESFASLLASPRIDQTTATIACLRDERTLGAPGEIGMVLTDDSELANRLRYIRAEFNPSDEHEGIESANFHPDTLLAAFLIEMLEKRLEAIRRRDHRIRELLFDLNQLGLRAIQVPIPDGNTACSRLVVFARKRDDLVHRLRGASSMRAKKWWPIPLHLQKGFRDLKYQQGDFPNCEALAAQNIELPLPSTYEERARLFAVLTEHSLVCEATPQEQYAL